MQEFNKFKVFGFAYWQQRHSHTHKDTSSPPPQIPTRCGTPPGSRMPHRRQSNRRKIKL